MGSLPKFVKVAFGAAGIGLLALFVFYEGNDIHNKYIVEHGTKLNECFLSYQGRIYAYGAAEFASAHDIGAHADQFILLSSDPSECLAKDDIAVYSYFGKIPGADPASFTLLSRGYAKDASTVYMNTKKISGADPATFSPINSEYDGLYSKDATHVYYNGIVMPDLDPAYFEFKLDEGIGRPYDFVRDTNTGTLYYRGKKVTPDTQY